MVRVQRVKISEARSMTVSNHLPTPSFRASAFARVAAILPSMDCTAFNQESVCVAESAG